MPNELDRRESIKQYFDCYANIDRDGLVKLLVKPFRFTSSYAEYDDRDKMLDAIWQHVIENNNEISNLEIFGEGDQMMAKYDLVGEGVANMCEFFRFEGDQIAAIEVFMGKSTFERGAF